MVIHEYFCRFDWPDVALLLLLHRSGKVENFKWHALLCSSSVAFCTVRTGQIFFIYHFQLLRSTYKGICSKAFTLKISLWLSWEFAKLVSGYWKPCCFSLLLSPSWTVSCAGPPASSLLWSRVKWGCDAEETSAIREMPGCWAWPLWEGEASVQASFERALGVMGG